MRSIREPDEPLSRSTMSQKHSAGSLASVSNLSWLRASRLHAGLIAAMTQRESGPSLRLTAALWISVFGAIAIALALALTYATHRLHRGTVFIVRDTESLSIADQVALQLEAHERLGNLLAVTNDPAFDEERCELEREIETHLAQATHLAANEGERELLAQAQRAVDTALAKRSELEARKLPLIEILRQTRDDFERAHTSMEELHALNRVQVSRALSEATRLDKLATALALPSAALMLVGLLALVVGLRRLVVVPLQKLAATIRRGHGRSVNAELRGAREIREITRAINEMSATLERQQAERLAFVAGIAHDLRNPLSVLRMAVVHARSVPSTAENTLSIADRQVAILTRMIDDFLDAARAESGELDLQLQELDLCAIAREVVEVARLHTTKHVFELQTPDCPVLVRADAVRVGQVIENLITNAIKYSPSGGPIVVRVHADHGAGKVEVVDRGIGISREDIPRLFDAFRRSSAGKAVAPGVGIGLSVVRRIVAAHGGKIDVESTVGQGSTFRVALPLSKSKAGAAAD
jgi:signal transduction histidine kinase